MKQEMDGWTNWQGPVDAAFQHSYMLLMQTGLQMPLAVLRYCLHSILKVSSRCNDDIRGLVLLTCNCPLKGENDPAILSSVPRLGSLVTIQMPGLVPHSHRYSKSWTEQDPT